MIAGAPRPPEAGGAVALKREALGLLRAAGLLKPADTLLFGLRRLVAHRRNRRFARSHPGLPVPPAALAFEAYGHLDRQAHFEVGRRHAAVYAGLIRDNAAGPSPAVLEWGCGPGRIVRHLPALLADIGVRLTGADCNGRSIAWCRDHLPGIDFVVNPERPPLPCPDDAFDFVYSFSVFSHLSEASQKAWAGEIRRVLKPGGVFVCTTNGEYYCNRLARRGEADRFRSGRVVVQGGYDEGRKWFFSLHPQRYVREELLRDFAEVTLLQPQPEALMRDDLWLARKPAFPAPAGAA